MVNAKKNTLSAIEMIATLLMSSVFGRVILGWQGVGIAQRGSVPQLRGIKQARIRAQLGRHDVRLKRTEQLALAIAVTEVGTMRGGLAGHARRGGHVVFALVRMPFRMAP